MLIIIVKQSKRTEYSNLKERNIKNNQNIQIKRNIKHNKRDITVKNIGVQFSSNMKNHKSRDANKRLIRTDGDYNIHSNKDIDRNFMTNPHQNYSSNIFNNQNTLQRELIDTDKTYNTIKSIQDYSNKSISGITPNKKALQSVPKSSNPLTKSKKWKDVIKYLQRHPKVLMSVVPDSINLHTPSIPKLKPIVDRTPKRMPRMQSDMEMFGKRKFSANSPIIKSQSKSSSVLRSRILKNKLQHSHSPSFNSKPNHVHRNCSK